MIFWIIYAALFVGFYYCQLADAKVSQEGFDRGYSEGNELATAIFGPHPSSIKLEIFNLAQLGVFLLPAVIWFPGAARDGWLIGFTVAAAGRHLMAVREWRKAFATNGASLIQGKTIWQKFLGL